MPVRATEMIQKTVTVPAVSEQVYDTVSVRCVRIADTGCNGPVYFESEISPSRVVDGEVKPKDHNTTLVRVHDLYATPEGLAVLNAIRKLVGLEIEKQGVL